MKLTKTKDIKMKNQFRVENGSVYQYSESQHAYIFIGKLNGRSLKKFLKDQQEMSLKKEKIIMKIANNLE